MDAIGRSGEGGGSRGRWLVLGIIGAALILGLIGLRFRKFAPRPATTSPPSSTTTTTNQSGV
jgi:hypothetical protein